MKKHLSLIVLCCLSMQLTAQIKNTYSFAQGDTTQVVITWDAWAETGDPISGCNIYRYEDQTNPINAELITSNDSAYYFVDTTGFDPYLPPKYIIKALRGNEILDVDYAHAFSSIEFFTAATVGLQMGIIPWHPDSCCTGVSVYVDDLQISFTSYNSPYSTPIPPTILPYPFSYYEWGFHFFISFVNSKIKLTQEFIDHLATTVGISAIPAANMNFLVSPNPASDHITFALENTEHHRNIELRCYNLLGMQQHQTQLMRGQQQATISVSTWPPGMYVVVVYSDGRPVGRGKFVVQR